MSASSTITPALHFSQASTAAIIRPINMRDFSAEVACIVEVYNDAWSDNWGFVPITDAEAWHMAKELKAVVIPELTLLAEIDGQPVGSFVAIPDPSVSRLRPSLSVVVALTRSSGPIPRRVSQQRLRNPAAPFPTRRLSSGWISLLSTGTMKPLRLPMALHAPLRFRSLSATLGRQGGRRLSQLPKGPLYAFALLFDPGPTELARARWMTCNTGESRCGWVANRRRSGMPVTHG